MAATAGNGATIDVLTTLCRRELAFVESYRQALNALSLREHSAELATCLRSHEQRAELLKSRLRVLHAEPPASGGVLGAVAKLLEGAAAAIGEKAGIMALEEEEDRGLRGYRSNFEKMDAESRTLIARELAPAQFETHRIISELRRTKGAGRAVTSH